MLAREENDLLTKIGPNTRGGNLLRRYWWPVGISADLRDRPTFVKLLGEELVLFRDARNRIGLLGAHCSHRRANLCFGTVEADGLRCRYHGWKYGTDGAVLDIPGESRSRELARQIHHPAYRLAEQGGLILAYLGPEPAPLVPQYDFLAAPGERFVQISGFSNSNWLQCVENGMDPTHVTFAHFDALPGIQDFPERIEHERNAHGMVHKTYRPGPEPGSRFYREHHLVMPGIAVTGAGQRRVTGGDGAPAVFARWTVPIDDGESMMVGVFYKPAENSGDVSGTASPRLFGAWTPVKIEPFREYRGTEKQPLGYVLPPSIPAQDASLLDSMGPISDREAEHLVASDETISMLRRLFLRALATVEAGDDPPGVFRRAGVVAVNAHERMLSGAVPA